MSDPIYYLFTTDGGDREDANVFYAQHLVVDNPYGPTQKDVIDAIVSRTLIADSNGRDIVYDRYDDETDEYIDAVEVVFDVLKSQGYNVNTVTPMFVVGV